MQAYLIFALAMVLVYLVLAGQYESWFARVAVVLSVPLALGVANNLYTQIGPVRLIALGSKNAILIVEAARRLFRPILMTSLAYYPGVAPRSASRCCRACWRRRCSLCFSCRPSARCSRASRNVCAEPRRHRKPLPHEPER